jgi:hypothetical protein
MSKFRVLIDPLGGRLPEAFYLPESIPEVLFQQPELPQLIGDVLADVGDRAVGTYDYLVPT